MDTQSVNGPGVVPAVEPRTPSKPRPRSRPQGNKAARLPIPEQLLILTIDDAEGIVTAPAKTSLHYGLAAAFLAELVQANHLQLMEDRLVLASTKPSRDKLYADILTMITADDKPRKLSRLVESIGGKLTIKQVAERLVERKVIVVEKKVYTWIIPYAATPQGQASAKYWIKLHIRGIVLAGEPANASDLILLSLLKACHLLRFVFTRDERQYADKKVAELVQGEVFGETVAKLLA